MNWLKDKLLGRPPQSASGTSASPPPEHGSGRSAAGTGYVNPSQGPGTYLPSVADELADRAEKLAANVGKLGPSREVVDEIKRIQAQLKNMPRASRARARTREAADVIFGARERMFTESVKEAEKLIRRLSRRPVDTHPGDDVKKARERFRDLQMKKPDRDRLRADLDRAVDDLFDRYRRTKEKVNRDRKASAVARLQDALARKEDALRRAEERIGRLREAENRAEGRRRDYAQRLRSGYGLFEGKTPLRRDTRQRDLESRVVDFERKVEDIRRHLRDTKNRRDDLARQVREIRDKIRSIR